ncbi:MAG: tetratricopeptide repeat protein [Bacteroidaceae bacterium]|nr:tetratricopeptide repeat protein [Bacteroidaceae bacterium]
MKHLLTVISILILLPAAAFAQQAEEDKEQLSNAIAYFNDSKYQEAALILRKLSDRYNLNSRYLAYLALCEHHLWNYKEAADIFDEVIYDLDEYSKQEQNVYYFAAAESNFELGNYKKAEKFYQFSLLICKSREKADIYYKLAFCHIRENDNKQAAKLLQKSLDSYKKHPTGRDDSARLSQIEKMLRGMKSEK